MQSCNDKVPATDIDRRTQSLECTQMPCYVIFSSLARTHHFHISNFSGSFTSVFAFVSCRLCFFSLSICVISSDHRVNQFNSVAIFRKMLSLCPLPPSATLHFLCRRQSSKLKNRREKMNHRNGKKRREKRCMPMRDGGDERRRLD